MRSLASCRFQVEWQGLADIEGKNWRDIADLAISKSMNSPDIQRSVGGDKYCYSGQIYLVNKVRGTATSSPRTREVAAVHEPPLAELVRAVIEAGREWELDISDRSGTLWLEDRAGRPVVPPVEIRFTADELVAYYRRTVAEGGHEDTPQSPLEWWRSLVSTHLAEAMYRLDGLDGPGVLHIDDYGITASRSPARPSASP